MKETFTRDEVHLIITGLCVFSGANSNQGLCKIHGENYGDKATHVLKCADISINPETNTGIVSMVIKLAKPLE